MVALCESWALENNVFFSTDPDPKKSKSKVVYMCGQKTGQAKPAQLYLSGMVLPWVPSATHLGNELHESGTMDLDTRIKRAKFIFKSLEIREMFNFAIPIEILKAMEVYTGSFYGSNLWELGGQMAGQKYSVWGTAVRLAWSVPRATRVYLAKHALSPDITSARVDILAKFIGFFRALRNSPSTKVSFIANLMGRDLRSVTGRNLRLLKDETGLDPWTSSPAMVKKELAEGKDQVPDGDE
jgi:hypothetical protein